MLGLLRFVGVINAAVWLGAAVFFTIAVAPGFFSKEMLEFLPRPYAGRAAQVIIERYFILQYWCAGIALGHLLAEWVYTGKPMPRGTFYLLTGILLLLLLGGLWIQPKLQRLHRTIYTWRPAAAQSVQTTQLIVQARHSFRVWHGVSQVFNLVITAGLLIYFWRATTPGSSWRFFSVGKFRG